MTTFFDNGYGASVIDDGYGNDERPYELAVLHDDKLCFRTPITDDVIGWLTVDDVKELKAAIAALPPQKYCSHKSPSW